MNHLLLPHYVLPTPQPFSNLDKLLTSVKSGIVEYNLQILETDSHLTEGVGPFVCIGVNRV